MYRKFYFVRYRHITEQRPMDGNNDFVSSSSYQSQQSVNFLHRMFLNHRPNDMSSERDGNNCNHTVISK